MQKISVQFAVNAVLWWIVTGNESQREEFKTIFGVEVLNRCDNLYDTRKLKTLLENSTLRELAA